MGKILVIFGSKSDEEVYSKITHILDKEYGHYEIRICSAHRTPEQLNDILKESGADVVIAGAGLAAHLPGAGEARCAGRTRCRRAADWAV